MLTRDQMEPLAREIAHFLVLCKAPVGSRWFRRKRLPDYNNREDLIPLKQKVDEDITYVRDRHGEARIRLHDILEQEPRPESIVIHPEIVTESEQKASATITIDNMQNDLESQPQVISEQFKDGESEESAISASMVNETWGSASVSASAEVPGASAEASVETGWKNTITAAWNKQTGRTKERTTGGTFSVKAAPHTYKQARVEWNEQTKRRRIECDARLDCKIQIGRKRRKGWYSGSPKRWDSIDELIAVAEKRGRVEFHLYEHFARMTLNAAQRASLDRIKELRVRHVDRLTPSYKGNADIKIVIVRLDTQDSSDD